LHDDGPIQRGSYAAHKIKGRRVGALLLLLLLLDREQGACQTIHFRFVWRDADTLSAPDNSVGIVTTEVFEQSSIGTAMKLLCCGSHLTIDGASQTSEIASASTTTGTPIRTAARAGVTSTLYAQHREN
jgi:hypothetical protein